MLIEHNCSKCWEHSHKQNMVLPRAYSCGVGDTDQVTSAVITNSGEDKEGVAQGVKRTESRRLA